MGKAETLGETRCRQCGSRLSRHPTNRRLVFVYRDIAPSGEDSIGIWCSWICCRAEWKKGAA